MKNETWLRTVDMTDLVSIAVGIIAFLQVGNALPDGLKRVYKARGAHVVAYNIQQEA